METEDSIVLLAAAPAVADGEYLYRPDGQLAGWIDGRFDVGARPAHRPAVAGGRRTPRGPTRWMS
jgi:hypothetical protein